MDVKRLGETIRKLRKGAGLTQEDLAEKAKIANRVLQRLEAGSGNPTFDTLEAISRAVGAPLVSLFNIESGGTMPAAALTDANLAGYKQLSKGKRNRIAAELEGAKLKKSVRGDAVEPSDLLAGFDFVSKFASQERDIQLTVMALVYEQPAYLSRLSPAFVSRLARLLSVSKK